MAPEEAAKMIADMINAASPIVSDDEVHAETWADVQRFLWGIRCRVASQVRLGSDKRMRLEDALEACRLRLRKEMR